MCGIVGAVAQRDVTPILVEGLKRLEYRGYDSAGVAVLNNSDILERVRVAGKIKDLEQAMDGNQLLGKTGIAHTRWATHGKPTIENAHPHICRDQVAIVHNGIIENHEKLRQQQLNLGYTFTSETDSEVIVNQIHDYLEKGEDLLSAVAKTTDMLEGHSDEELMEVSKGLLALYKGIMLEKSIGKNPKEIKKSWVRIAYSVYMTSK